MEISDKLEIEIFHTLEQIKRMNEAIHRHESVDEPNQFMVSQFRQTKARLSIELQQLMSQVTESVWSVAA